MAAKSLRSLYLMQEINEASAGAVVAGLLHLDQESHLPIRLFVKNIGGDWDEGRRICDTLLSQLNSPVITIVMHNADSSATPIFASGSIRLAFKQAKFTYHRIGKPIDADEVGARWYEEDLLRYARVYVKSNDEYLSYCTRRLPTHLKKCTLNIRSLRVRIRDAEEKEYEIDAREAKRLGLVDAIIKSVDDIAKFEKILCPELEST